jgi:hypothetical protein
MTEASLGISAPIEAARRAARACLAGTWRVVGELASPMLAYPQGIGALPLFMYVWGLISAFV